MSSSPITVLVVDDSALVRRIITEGLNRDPMIRVVGGAADPFEAGDKIAQLSPQVLTLDVEMPKMDGVEFLRRLMPQHPLPVVMVSSLTERGKQVTMDALAAGAVDFVAKPSGAGALELMVQDLCRKVKIAATANVSHWKGRTAPVAAKPAFPKPQPAAASTAHVATHATTQQAGGGGNRPLSRRIVAIGASTGGTEALREVICGLSPAIPAGVVVVQHMPVGFTKMFADRLNGLAQVTVKEAVDGEQIVDGQVIIAAGGKQMEVVPFGNNGWRVRVFDGPECCGHRPSVEVMMNSVAKNCGKVAVGVMLTGMGSDGANGMKAMRDAGARCFAQDEATCVVFGMPKEAYARGGAERLVPLPQVAGQIAALLR
ncbi:MAG: protein-glutamate methylesterase/protein-glutamine glutaminase [Thermoguttaceae bacterium]